MKKSVYLIILAVVTIFCIIFGAFINLRFAGRGFNKVKKAITKSIEDGFDYDSDTDIEFDDDFEDIFDDDDDYDENTIGFDSKTLEAFDQLVIDASVLGVIVERGTSYSITAKYNNSRLKPEYSLKDGRLYITQRVKRRNFVGNNTSKVVVTVPYNTSLDKIDIDIDVGAVEMSGFDVDNANIRTDVGAVAVSKLDFKDLVIKSDVGAVAVELLEDVTKYDISAKSDVGGIQVDNASVKRRYSNEGTNGKKLRINTNVGGIEIK